jgi:Ca2+-binding RTX toxin-like protein
LDFRALRPPPRSVGVSVDLSRGQTQVVTPRQLSLTLGDPNGIEAISGSQGNDRLAGNGLANLIRGLGGNDTIAGAGGDDTLDGGGGADLLQGDEGDDLLLAFDGNIDTLFGGGGNDRSELMASPPQRDPEDLIPLFDIELL